MQWKIIESEVIVSLFVLLNDIIQLIYSISVPSIETGGGFMSNHSGSRMLNDVIQVLNDEEVLNTIGLQKSQQVITQIVDIASRIYDFLIRLLKGESHIGIQLTHRLRELSGEKSINIDSNTNRRTLFQLLRLAEEETSQLLEKERELERQVKIQKLEVMFIRCV